MEKKVTAILNIVKNIYKECSPIFHEYFIGDFKASIVSLNLQNKKILMFDEDAFCKFIDECITFRLGLHTNEPKASSIIYDLSSNVSPEVYTESLNDILERLIYSALPANLVKEIKERLESYTLDEAIVSLILSKLE